VSGHTGMVITPVETQRSDVVVASTTSAASAALGVAPSRSVSHPVGSITEAAPVVESDTDADVAHDRPWKVIVWNDPVNLMSYVTFVLQKLFGHDLETATALMLEIHHDGRAVVADGGREEAEMHVFRLHEHGLWATMEHES